MSLEDEVDELARMQAEDVFEEKISDYADRIDELETLTDDQQETIHGLENGLAALGKEFQRFRDEMIVKGQLPIDG